MLADRRVTKSLGNLPIDLDVYLKLEPSHGARPKKQVMTSL